MKQRQANFQPSSWESPPYLKTAEVTDVTEASEIRPLQPIRRFDVFAETKRLEALAHGEADDVAKGYGIRIAKIVASRHFGGSKTKKTRHEKKEGSERESS